MQKYIITQNRKSVVNVTNHSFYLNLENNTWVIYTGRENVLIEKLGCYETIEEARSALFDICKFLKDEKSIIFALPRHY